MILHWRDRLIGKGGQALRVLQIELIEEHRRVVGILAGLLDYTRQSVTLKKLFRLVISHHSLRACNST